MDNKVFVDDENVTTIEVDPQASDNTVPSDPPPSYDESKNFNTSNPNGTEPNGIEPHETKQNGTKQNGATSTGVDTFQVEPKPNGTADDGDKDEKKDDAKVEVKMVSVATLFRYATKMDILLMILGTLCSCAHGAALPGLLIVFGEMTDSFVYVAKSDVAASLNVTLSPAELESIGTSSLLDQMSEYAVYYTIMGVGVIFVAFGQVTFWLMASYRQCQRLRLTLFRCIMKQNIGWFDTHEAGELSTRLADDVNKVQEGIGDKIGNFFQWFSTFLAGFIIGFIYGWKLTLVILAVSPLLAISGGLMTKMMTDFTNSEMSAYAKAGAVAEEVFSSIRTVTAFGGQKKECERYGKNLVDAYKYGVKKSMVSGGGMGIVFLIIFCVYALAFWYGSKLVREDEAYTAGRVLIVFFCVLIGAFALGNAAPNLQNFAAARGSAHSLFEIIDTQPPFSL